MLVPLNLELVPSIMISLYLYETGVHLMSTHEQQPQTHLGIPPKIGCPEYKPVELTPTLNHPQDHHHHLTEKIVGVISRPTLFSIVLELPGQLGWTQSET